MSTVVAGNTTKEHASSWDLPSWLDHTNKISEQNVFVAFFHQNIHTTGYAEKGLHDWEYTASLGLLSYYSVILDSSFTEQIQPPIDNSANTTAEEEKPEALTENLYRIFFEAREEVFEDGMDSVFSRRLVNFMERYSRLGIDILCDLLILERVNAEVSGEALRHVGYLEHTPTRIPRRRLLEHCLFGSSARIRDGAILGIAAIDDPNAIPSVIRAIERETIPELKRDMTAVLEQLRETKKKV